MWKASFGRSGAGRFFSSRTLARTVTRLTFRTIFPPCGELSAVAGPAGVGCTIFPGSPLEPLDVLAEAEPFPVAFEAEAEFALRFCAQGGRSGFSCAQGLAAAKSSERAMNRARAGRERGSIGS